MTNFGREIAEAETFYRCIEIYKEIMREIEKSSDPSSNKGNWVSAYDALKKALRLARTKELADQVRIFACDHKKGRKNFEGLARSAKNKVNSLKF